MAKVGVSLQQVIGQEPSPILFASRLLAWCANNFSFMNQIKFDHHWLMRDNVTATEYRGRQMRIQTCVKVKGGYFDHKLCISVTR